MSKSPLNRQLRKVQGDVRKLLEHIYVNKANSCNSIQGKRGQINELILSSIGKVFDQNHLGQPLKPLKQAQLLQLKDKLDSLVLSQKSDSPNRLACLPQIIPFGQSSKESLITPNNTYGKSKVISLQLSPPRNLLRQSLRNQFTHENSIGNQLADYSIKVPRCGDHLDKLLYNNPNCNQSLIYSLSKDNSLHNIKGNSIDEIGFEKGQRLNDLNKTRKKVKELMGSISSKNVTRTEIDISLKQQIKDQVTGEQPKNNFFNEIGSSEEYLKNNRNDLWTLFAKFNKQKDLDFKRKTNLQQKKQIILMQNDLAQQIMEKQDNIRKEQSLDASYANVIRLEQAQRKNFQERDKFEIQMKKIQQSKYLDAQVQEKEDTRKKQMKLLKLESEQLREILAKHNQDEFLKKQNSKLQEKKLYEGIKQDYLDQFNKVQSLPQFIDSKYIFEQKRNESYSKELIPSTLKINDVGVSLANKRNKFDKVSFKNSRSCVFSQKDIQSLAYKSDIQNNLSLLKEIDEYIVQTKNQNEKNQIC